MRISRFTKGLFLWMLTFNVMQTTVISADVSVENDDCTQKALRSFFPEKYVKESLQKFHVPESKWSAITQGLTAKEQDVARIVEEKAQKMSSNPLKDPNQRQTAVKIFKDTLYETASQVLKANGITDDKQIQDMVDDIQHQKAKQFAQCIEKHKFPAMPMPNGTNTPTINQGSSSPNVGVPGSGSGGPGYNSGIRNDATQPRTVDMNINIDRSPVNLPKVAPGNSNRPLDTVNPGYGH